MADYTQIDNPFNNQLIRSDGGLQVVLGGGGNTNANTEGGSGSITSGDGSSDSSGTSNGSVAGVSVKSSANVGDIFTESFIRSVNWQPKKVGFTIDGATGYAEFTNVYVSGNIQALTGTIGSFTIGTYLYTGSKTAYNDANAGVHIGGDGIGIGNNVFTVSSAGALVATSATITGAVTATSGTIGSFTIGTYLYTGSKTAYNDANAGVHIGSDGIGIGNNVFTVSSSGALTATSANITGTISSSTITGSTLSTATSGQRTVLTADFLTFYNSSNVLSGQIYGSSSDGGLMIETNGASAQLHLKCGGSGSLVFRSDSVMATMSPTAFRPYTDKGLILGASNYQWSDLYLGTNFWYRGKSQPQILVAQLTGGSTFYSTPGLSAARDTTGKYTITHNIGTTDYFANVTASVGTGYAYSGKIEAINANSLQITIFDDGGTARDSDWCVTIYIL
jgi:hypothetical protein